MTASEENVTNYFSRPATASETAFSPRGRFYGKTKAFIERTLSHLYVGDWPGRLWGRIPGTTEVRVIRHELTLRAPSEVRRPPLRLAFASDLHLGPTTPRRLLDRAFAELEKLAPDVIAFGGDYVFLAATDARAKELEARVRDVPARFKVAVLGNHDLWTDHRRIEDALTRAGATVLVNDAIRLPAPHDDVAILGLDEPWTGAPDGPRAIAACGDATTRIAIAHAPDALPHLEGDVALLVCGHTHGGQVALPRRPLYVHGRYGKRYPFGMHAIEGGHLFVSRGLGGVEIPVRLFAPPDVALFSIS